MTSEKEDAEKQYFMYISLGCANSSLGITFIIVDSLPGIASLGFFLGAVLFFIIGGIDYRKNSSDSTLLD
jgi:hypothetical protein